MSDVVRITFEELKALNSKPIESIKPYNVSTEIPRGIMTLNGINVFGCFYNKVSCTNDSFAMVHFYDKDGKEIAIVTVFNVNDECLIVKEGEYVYSETNMRVMFDEFYKTVNN